MKPQMGADHLAALLSEDLPQPLDWLVRHPKRQIFVEDHEGALLAAFPFIEAVEHDARTLWAPHVDGLLCGVDVNVYSLEPPDGPNPSSPNQPFPGENTIQMEAVELVGRACRLQAGTSRDLVIHWREEKARRIEAYAWGPCLMTRAELPQSGLLFDESERKTIDLPAAHGMRELRVRVRCL
jgi:hypothetical protein